MAFIKMLPSIIGITTTIAAAPSKPPPSPLSWAPCWTADQSCSLVFSGSAPSALVDLGSPARGKDTLPRGTVGHFSLHPTAELGRNLQTEPAELEDVCQRLGPIGRTLQGPGV